MNHVAKVLNKTPDDIREINFYKQGQVFNSLDLSCLLCAVCKSVFTDCKDGNQCNVSLPSLQTTYYKQPLPYCSISKIWKGRNLVY